MTTIENSYCVLRTVEEWATVALLFPQESGYYESIEEWMTDFIMCGYVNLLKFDSLLDIGAETYGRVEIPVTHFLDLLHDRIAGWRLEEVGFVKSNNSHRLQVSDYSVDWVWSYNFAMVTGPRGFSDFKGITTFTDLLTLIRMLTPPPEET